MPKEPSIAKLELERQSILRAALAGSSGEAWTRVRKHLIDSPSILPDEGVATVWEGPGRGWLLPLPFEVLRDFIRQFQEEATKHLIDALRDPEPLVVGYALHALSELDASHFSDYISAVEGRIEQIHTIYGSFGWNGSLSDYAIRLCDDV